MTNNPKQITIPAAKTVLLYRGIQSRIAARLGIHPSFVSKVVHGKKHSRRVESEIRRELARIARQAA